MSKHLLGIALVLTAGTLVAGRPASSGSSSELPQITFSLVTDDHGGGSGRGGGGSDRSGRSGDSQRDGSDDGPNHDLGDDHGADGDDGFDDHGVDINDLPDDSDVLLVPVAVK
jgi:hypothetical protein